MIRASDESEAINRYIEWREERIERIESMATDILQRLRADDSEATT